MLPLTARRRQWIRDTIARVYEEHGFEPLETPSFERLETLLGKYGEEGDQLIFRILHRGAELTRALAKASPGQDALADLGLRYDLTVPLARVVAEYAGQLPRYFKRYQLQPVWRADKPQKGRFREFTQCDLDLVGCAGLVADAEVLGAAGLALERLGFTDVALRLNHRDLLAGLIEAAGIAAARETDALVALDKLDKIGWEGVLGELGQRGIGAEAAAALRGMIEAAQGDNRARLEALRGPLASSARGRRGVEELTALLGLLAQTPAAALVQVDPCLARGLSYYTGPIFEATSPRLAGSLGGGGRYDRLIGMFSGQQTPAVGFSMGLERLEVVLEELGLFPPALQRPDVMLAYLDAPAAALGLAAALRRAGLRVEVFPEPAKIGKQISYAEARGIDLLLLQGEQELARGELTLQRLSTRDRQTIARADAVEAVRAALGATA
jgi:histidyl-tRNA synthetase